MSLYAFSIPTYQQILGGMIVVLDKTIAYAAAKKLDHAVVLNDRLALDMFNFARQIQTFTDHAAGSCLRCAGKEATLLPRDETTLEGLRDRVAHALSVVNSVSAADVDAHATTDITFPIGPRKGTMKGKEYMMNFALPNFYFHVITAYDILRHRGVEIGKWDYLGVVPDMRRDA